MIVCPACHHKELFGTIFCSECGAQLVQQGANPNAAALREAGSNGQAGYSSHRPAVAGPLAHAALSLHLVENDRVLALQGREEYTLGRASGNQPVLPDVDLSPFQAYESGVSRLHATIKIKDGMVWVTDLGSSNGTRVNGKKISSHTLSPLEPGDILMLGALKIQVLFQTSEVSKTSEVFR